MKKTNLRKSKGITLIALVITIIVLLILAGVAISMLSGENGILRKAAEAKTKTEEGQNQEETALTSMELATYFLTENKEYKCSNGFITGIKVGTKVSELQSALPDGYTVKAIDGTDNLTATKDGQLIVTTGLAIQKDNKTVARTIIFGDVDCSGEIDSNDSYFLIRYKQPYVSPDEYRKVAANVNNDKEYDGHDVEMISKHVALIENISQDKYVSVKPKDIKMDYTKMQEYLKKVNDDIEYKIKYDEEKDKYTLTGIENNTTVKQLKDKLPEIDSITIDTEDDVDEITDESIITNGYYIIKKTTYTYITVNGRGNEKENNVDLYNKIFIKLK